MKKFMYLKVLHVKQANCIDQIIGYFGNIIGMETPNGISGYHSFDSDIVDISISSTGSIAVLLSSGYVYHKNQFHDFHPLSLPSEDFLNPEDGLVVPQLVLFGGDFSLLACYNIKKRMVALMALEAVCLLFV